MRRRAIGSIMVSGALALATAAPALAQPGYAGGVTVYGHPYWVDRLPNGDPELSRAVPYADLDLATPEGRAELDWRIGRTADHLCGRLGEPPEQEQNTTVLPSCQAAARDTAYRQARRAVEAAPYRVAYPPGPPPGYLPPPPRYAPVPQGWAGPPCGCEPPYRAWGPYWRR